MNNTLKDILIFAGILIAIVAVLLSLGFCVKSCQSPTQETICYQDTIIYLNTNDVVDIIYKPNTKTFWVELDTNDCHYMVDSVAYELIWDCNNPDSINHDYYIEYNIDGESEVKYIDKYNIEF